MLPKVVEQLKIDVATDIKTLKDEEIGMWATPEGEAYIDGEVVVVRLSSLKSE